MYFQTVCCAILFNILWGTTSLAQESFPDSSKMRQHPRLLLLAGQEDAMIKNIATNPYLQQVHKGIISECDAISSWTDNGRPAFVRPVERSLATHFFPVIRLRTTGKNKYFKRCEEELIAVSKFTDWNTSHFLDVAEMTMAVAIGYDWLYKSLSPASRTLISKAIIEKGINPSFDSKKE